MTLRRMTKTIGFYLLVAVILIYTLFPVYYAAITSFANDGNQFELHYLPENLSMVNYAQILHQRNFTGSLAMSVLVATVSVGGAMLVAVLAAYALGRIRFRGRGLLLMTILFVSIFPQVAILAGMYELLQFMGLYNTIWALILSQLVFTLPFSVWLLTTFMRQLPVEVEEAAILDGATPWVVVTQIFLPLLRPAMVTTALLAFIGAWNEFLFAKTFVISEHLHTVPLSMSMISGVVQQRGPTMAASIIVTVPIVALVLVMQRRIVSGLTAGSVVG
jgi:trehalose/maltose transport system permease protein